MSTQRMGVNLSFNADTKKAQTEIMNLQKQLNGLLSNTNLDKDINSIIPKIAELSAHLKNAINVDTGNLDFTKLNKSLKTSGTTLKEYGENLQKLGPKGQQAFLSLTKAVASAEVPIRKTNKLVKELGETLANTARWQLSSSVLHGFMGALQGAYGYAKDLNAALNDIQIVTGLNTEEMSAFAKEANKAAQALSATTVEYTKASLIYFQQGLSTQEVKERADITVKLSKITKQSADSVSNQLTAIWSNYYDGSKSLESYADALTALGAATASSSDEISKGLQKFSAVANTVGLSYEYAASALATLTANTRESADVVGTALKTLFARIQGLQLGETLDDGTTLNKYSEALRVVGVNIMDTKGQLKSMDTILDEIGGKWQKLGKDQQQALAQTVAGVRQYNQFMALMNNWNNGDSDSMQANLRTIKESEGALQNQADIYAKSWEAARDRVTAAMESIYDKLLKDEFFIDLTNGVEKVISFVDLLIDRLGGLQGVLFSVGAIVTKVFSSQISQGLTNAAYNISMMTKKGQEKVETERMDYLKNAKDSVQTNPDFVSKSEQAMQDQIESSIELQQLYLDNVSKMTLQEQELNKILIDRTNLMREQAVTTSKSVEVADSQVEKTKMKVSSHLKDGVNIVDLNANIKKLRQGQEAIVEIEDIFDHWDSKLRSGKVSIEEFKSSIAKIGADKGDLKDLIENFSSIDMNAADAREEIDKLLAVIQRINNKTTKDIKAQVDDDSAKSVDEMTVAIEKQTQATYENKKATEAAKKAQEASEEAIKGAKGAQKEWADIIVESVNVALSMASAITMVSSAITTLSDPDVSGWDKFLTILTTLSMLVPTLISVFKTLQSVLSTETIAKVANTIATWKMEQADRKAAAAKDKSAKAANKNAGAVNKETAKKTVGKKVEEGWESFKQPFKKRSDTWNKSVWDKSDDAAKDKAREAAKKKLTDKGMKDAGYKKLRNGDWTDGVMKISAEGAAPSNVTTEAIEQTAMKSMGGKAFGSMASGAGLIAAGVAVAVGAIAWGVHQFTKYDKAAEEAAERSRQAAEAFQSVSNAYQSFTGNLSGYEEANKGLDSLVKGTIEYKEALLQANESAQALIDSTKGMDNELKFGVDYDIDSDGRIKIKEESLERVQQEKLDNMQKASVNKQVMAISAQRKQAEADSIKLQREDIKSLGGIGLSISNVLAATGAGAASGAGIGAGVGLLGGPVGVGAGAGIGALIGGITGLITGIGGQIAAGGAAVKEEEKVIKKITETFDPSVFQDQTKYEEAIGELNINDSALIESLKNNREAMQELAKNVQEANAATKALNKQMVTAALADNKKVQDGKHAEDVIATVSTFFEEDQKTEAQSLIKEGWGTEGINKGTKVNKEVERVFEEYAKAAGLEGAKVTDTTGTDKNRKFIYEIDGKEVEVSLDDMREVVARQKAADAANTRAEQLTEIFNEFTDEQSAAVTAAKTGEFTNLNLGQLWGEAVTAESLGLSTEDLTALGYDTAAAFNDAFVKAQEAGLAALDPVLPKDLFGIKKLSVEEATKVANVFKEINLGPQGEKAGKDFTDGLNKMLVDVKPEDQEDALNALMTVDWSSWDALEQAAIIMEDFGVHINASGEEWKTFVESMRTATGAMPDYSHIKKDLTEITAILEDLDFGSVISEDDYNRLIEYNNAWKDFFQLQANGTRIFIGNSDTMLEATRNRIQEERKALQKDVEIQNKLLKHWGSRDWDSYGTNTKGLNDLLGFYDNKAIGADTQAVLNSLGYDKKTLEAIKKEANEGNTERLKQLYSRLSELQDASYINDDKDLEEQMASTAKTYEDLDKLFTAGQIGSSKTGKTNETTAYEKQVNNIANSAIQAAESLEELNSAKAEGEKYNAVINNDIYNESLERIAENAYNSVETLEDLISTNNDFSKTTLDSIKRTELYNENLEKLAESAYGSAKNLDDLNSINTRYINANLDSTKRTELYRDSLINLGNSYSHAKDEVKKYEEAIKSNDTTAIASAESQLKNAIKLGEVANELGLNADELNKLTSNLSKGFGEGFENALKYAQGYLILAEKLGISVEDLQSNFANLTEAFSSLTYAQIDTLFNKIASAAEQSNLDINALTETTIKIGDALNLSSDKAVNTATLFMTASEEYGLSTEELVFQTQQLASSLSISNDKAAKLAVQNQRMNKGISTLASNWGGWKKTLKETDKTSTDYAKTMIELTDTVRDLVGAGEEFTLTSEFVTTNMELIEDAAEGDIKAINKLGVATAKAAVGALEMDNALKTTIQSSLEEGKADPFAGFADFDTNVTTVQTGLQTLFDSISNGTLTAGQSITTLGKDWVTAFNQMALQTGMSVDEMNSLLSQMGVDAEVKVDEVKTQTKVPVYETREEIIDDGSKSGLRVTQTSSSIIGYDTMDSVLQVPSINGESTITYTGNGNVSTSARTSGGSTTAPTKEEKKEFKERYETSEKAIKKADEEKADAERDRETSYGSAKVNKLTDINTALADKSTAIGNKKTKAGTYLTDDKTALQNAYKAVLGEDISIDATTNQVTTDMEAKLSSLETSYNNNVNTYNAAIDTAMSDGVIAASEQEALDAQKKALEEQERKINELKEAYSQYEDTLNVVIEAENEMLDIQNEIKSNNYQKAVEALDLNLKDNTLDIQEYDYYLNKYSEDIYSMSDGISKLQSKLTSTKANLTDYGDHLDKLREAYANGEITEADYYAGLEETRNSIYEQLEALSALDKEMQNYYGDTLIKAGEEIGKYTDKIENLSGVLDHYQSLLTLIGKENDFQSMGVVLQGITDTAEDARDAAKKEYEMYAAQAANRKEKYEAELQANDGVENEETKMLKQQWEEAEKATAESQDRMLAKTAEWGEAMKAVVENNLKSYAKTLEDTLAGEYGSFDDMTTAMERKQSLNEEYLTTTNKIYETEKMMRATQKAIDETTNQAAKNRLKTFMEQTKELQQQGKLSEHELSLHQAEYDLVLAQIALEEAQSAKSTVRLQRDAEGNFGYVYTADSAQVADAEQKVADAQNALYNKQLEGANNYTQKYQQTLSEMYDTMSSLQEQYLSGEIATETEYNEKMTAAKEYYYQKLEDFSDLYTVSTTGNSAVIADAWSADFADMTAQTETWKNAVETYSTNCSGAFTAWSGVISQIKQTTGEDLDKLAEKVNSVTTESTNLKDALIGKDDEKGIIELMGDELSSVTTTTDAYAAQRDTLKTLVTEYEKYAEAIKKVMQAKNSNASTGTGASDETDTSDFIVGTSVKIKSSATKYADDFDIASTDKTKNYTIAKISEDKKSALLKDDANKEKNWIKISDIEKLNTGGYTGEWGPEGKLAVLHEKEIVLNAQDTENLLAAVSTLRVILNAIDTHSMSAQIGGMLSTPGFAGGGSEVLEQNVKIEASFPGVQDRNEIEEAFNNLINRASQYANKK